MATKKKSTKRRSTGRQLTARKKARPKVPATPAASPISLQRDLRESIDREIADRIRAHQREVVRVRESVLEGAEQPLILLAHGDSWFDYPCNGNTYTPFSTSDIVAHLQKMGSPRPKILNISHHGDATTDEMGLAKQMRLIEALSDPKNWPKGKPDAILFSGGGNDIAGDEFCIYLNYKGTGLPALDRGRFAERLASIRASYEDLLAFRDRYAPKVPIFGHGYDYAHPMKPHPPCAGPWISPSLGFAGWNDAEGTQVLRDVIDAFQAMLVNLASSGFLLVPTLGTLTYDDWANELHPHPPGFERLAQRFLLKLRERFPGRI